MLDFSAHRVALASFLATALVFVMYQVGVFDVTSLSQQKGVLTSSLTYCPGFGYTYIPPHCECLLQGNSALCRSGFVVSGDNADYCCHDSDFCGDDTTQSQRGEQCDDGNTVYGDGCDGECKTEFCGDGATQPQLGEQCDDGNFVDDDGCTALCMAEVCGDNTTQSYRGEQCDDGNTVYGDGCDEYCQSEACGNFIPQAGEECDDGNTDNNDGCNSACKWERCGDTDIHTGEDCDDGNTVNNDGCSSTCKDEFCGDSITQTSEQCDDGGTVIGDGCDASCRSEVCGNTILQVGEVCDDGNANYYDGCNTECQDDYCGDGNIDPGEACDDGNGNHFGDGCGTNCEQEFCGDGIQQSFPDGPYEPEECDDGNGDDYDSCTRFCKTDLCGNGAIHLYNPCLAGPVPPGIVCGDYPAEPCDDGNRLNNDGCDRNCVRELCGNNTPDSGEQCDDGNFVDGDGCDKYCRNEVCGNGVLQGTPEKDTDGDGVIDVTATGAGEGCEVTAPGLLYNPTNVCGPYWPECDPVTCHCYNNGCGDGIMQRSETCDDGNRVSFDGCSAGCRLETCGNGVREGANSGTLVTWWETSGPRYSADVGEKCDDGNTINGDGCSNTCTIERCGDGIRNFKPYTDTDGDGNFDSTRRKATLCHYPSILGCPTTLIDVDGDGDNSNEPPATGEACDDGNTIDDDGCRQDCTLGCEDDFDCPDFSICQPGRCGHTGNCPPFTSCISGICYAHTTYTCDPLEDPGSCLLTCKDGNLVDKLAILMTAGSPTTGAGGANLLGNLAGVLTGGAGSTGGSSSSKGNNAALCEVTFSYPCDPGGADCGHAKVHTEWGAACCNGAGSQDFDFSLNPLPPIGGVIVEPAPTADGLTVSLVGVCNGGAAGKKFIPACTCGSSESSESSEESSSEESSESSEDSSESSLSISAPSSGSFSSSESSGGSSSSSLSVSAPSSGGSGSSGSSESSESSEESSSEESSESDASSDESSSGESSSSGWFCDTTVWMCVQQ